MTEHAAVDQEGTRAQIATDDTAEADGGSRESTMSCHSTTARTLQGALESSGRSLVAALIVVALLAFPACGAKRRNQRDDDRSFLTSDALYDRAIEELAEGDLGKSREFLERIQLVDPASNRRLEPLVRLALADATFLPGRRSLPDRGPVQV